jgi:hypothetical protein
MIASHASKVKNVTDQRCVNHLLFELIALAVLPAAQSVIQMAPSSGTKKFIPVRQLGHERDVAERTAGGARLDGLFDQAPVLSLRSAPVPAMIETDGYAEIGARISLRESGC